MALAAGNLLGILEQDPEDWFQATTEEGAVSAEAIETLVEQRQQAKLDKDYALADKIREDLKARGVALEDSREGTKWRRE